MGDILTKSDVGTYSYAGSTEHGVSAIATGSGLQVNGATNPAFTYDADGNMLSGANRSITWTSFDMPLAISSNAGIDGFVYDDQHRRARRTVGGSGPVAPVGTTYYFYEGAAPVERYVTSTIVEWHDYQSFGGGNAGTYVRKLKSDGVTLIGTKTLYAGQDPLGTAIQRSAETNHVGQYDDYDAWGRLRNLNGAADTGGAAAAGADYFDTTRLFTGQEFLQDSGLVHLNGRIYDPQIGRMLSADPISHPMMPQGMNGYAYVHNGPLNATDPTGFDDGDDSGGGSADASGGLPNVVVTGTRGGGGAINFAPPASFGGCCGTAIANQDSRSGAKQTPGMSAGKTPQCTFTGSRIGAACGSSAYFGAACAAGVQGACGAYAAALAAQNRYDVAYQAVVSAVETGCGPGPTTCAADNLQTFADNLAATGTGIDGVAAYLFNAAAHRSNPGYINDFLDKYQDAVETAEQQDGICKDCLLGLGAYESGWGQSPAARLWNNLFGLDSDNGTVIRHFPTTADGIQAWLNDWGARAAGAQDPASFVQQVNANKAYNSVNPKWGSTVISVIGSTRCAVAIKGGGSC